MFPIVLFSQCFFITLQWHYYISFATEIAGKTCSFVALTSCLFKKPLLQISHPANFSPCHQITIIKLSILPIIVANRMVSLLSRNRVFLNVKCTAFPCNICVNFPVFLMAVINCTLHFPLAALEKALKYLQ